MQEIERANPDTLFRVFGSADWGNKEKFSDELLKDLLEGFSDIELGKKTRGAGGVKSIKLTFDADRYGRLFRARKGTIEIKCWAVGGFQGGYSTGNSNLIVVCKRSWWTKGITDSERRQTAVHELGHKIGMAATGDRPFPANPGANDVNFIDHSTPDSHGSLYGEYHRGANSNAKGHVGNHCEKGMTAYDASKDQWSGTPGCVMFGGSPTRDAATGQWNDTPIEFCGDCAESVRKVDLNGFHITALKGGF